MGAGAVVATGTTASDTELVAGVRAGDDAAFEELYRRYQRRISSYVRRVTRDEERAEDVTQEAFMSALRRMRATDSEIAFKPWIYEIARNAAIDHWRRSSRAQEVSISEDEQLRPGDRSRLVGGGSPETSLFQKERIDHLRRAMDELSRTYHRIIVMRELEGLSYREIGERLELSRPAVESTLFRARRRLEREYEEIEAGRRCEAVDQALARISEGVQSPTDMPWISRHARGCSACRRRARQMGVEPLRSRRVAARAAAVLPLPGFLRRRVTASQAPPPPGPDAGLLTGVAGPTAHVGAAVAERAAALVAAVAVAGAGGAMLSGPATPERAQPAADHHRQAAPSVGHPRAPHARQHPMRGRSDARTAPRRRDWKARSRSGSPPRAGKSRPAAPAGKADEASGPSSPGSIEPPTAPEVPGAPSVRLAPPAGPSLPAPPAADTSAPTSLPSPPAVPELLRDLDATGSS